jgi:23S rRNA (guanosine2251-2'-O)-methyltransferase
MAKRKAPRNPKTPAADRPSPAKRRADRRADHPGERPPARAADRGADRGALDRYWLYGRHAVLAALENPRRRGDQLLLTAEAARRHEPQLKPLLGGARRELVQDTASRDELGAQLPENAVHQGLAFRVWPLAQPDWAALDPGPGDGRDVVVALDQVTDPQNVGAVLRSAAAFGAMAVITTARHAAPESGAMAKAASGALETVPYLQVGNLAQALDRLKADGFWTLGLAGEAEASLADCDPGPRAVLVLGAEGSGLRRLTRERCDLLARLPTRPPIDQLNISSAAAVALYELLGRGAP